MYLKSISIQNYRKFGEEQTFEFAHSSWEKGINSMLEEKKEEETEKYISKSTSLFVGKNNAGKSTVINLLNRLQNTKCGNRAVFQYNDFNLKYLHEWYKKYFESSVEINDISPEDLPFMKFELKVGIDDGNDIISNFKDILVISGLKEIKNNPIDDNQPVVTITIRYEVIDVEKFKKQLIDLRTEEREINSKESSYYKGLIYRKFLQLFNENYYALNFYPLDADEYAEQFSLAPLLKVDVVEANTVKDNHTLSKAYSKIVSTYAKNNDINDITEVVNELNSKVKNMVDDNVKEILQNAVSAVEATKNLQMNLYPDVTLEKVLAHNIIYEYQENEDNIPETQYGMGYTNLMVIIANIVNYLELYKEDDINGAINILCIEEPESFMHPQMQELFIRNISKAIARLLGKKGELDTFQILITTHSSHILNSKIHSANSLDNIIYLGNFDGHNLVRNIKDKDIKDAYDEDNKLWEYTKKYLRLEANDIFFADAIILVEGLSEETYIRYLIDEKTKLYNCHIKVYRIDGAYAHKFISLLNLIGVKTVIITDLDLKREKRKDKNGRNIIDKDNIKDLTKCYGYKTGCITTNNALRAVIEKAFGIPKNMNNKINEKIISTINDREFLRLDLPNTNITIYSQGKIKGSFATSFEEAIILTNSEINRDSIKRLLRRSSVHISSKEQKESKHFANNSYNYQRRIASGQRKEKFSTNIVRMSIGCDGFELKEPAYIYSALEEICQYFNGDTNE